MATHVALGLFLLCVARINAIDDAMMEMAAMLHKSCVEETGVEEKVIEEARKNTLPDDANLKCYMKCLMESVQIFTDDGDVDIDVALEIAPEEFKEMAGPILRKCGTVKGADLCETAFLTNKCWQAAAPNDYYLV